MCAMRFLLTFITDAILRSDQCVEPSDGACRVRSSTLARNWGVSFCGGLAGVDCHQTRNTILLIALLPAGYRRRRSSELFLNIAITHPFIHQQHNSHPLRHANRQLPHPQVGVKFAALGGGQMQAFDLRHSKAKSVCYRLLRDSPLVGFQPSYFALLGRRSDNQKPPSFILRRTGGLVGL